MFRALFETEAQILRATQQSVDLGFDQVHKDLGLVNENLKALIEAVQSLSFLHPGLCSIDGVGQIDGAPVEVTLECEVFNTFGRSVQ